MHLTDDQLNEYLDDESSEHGAIKTHLDSCAECAARFSALQTLFAELDSLPDAALSINLAARFLPDRKQIPQLPRWLTLTISLQAVGALIALALAAPFVSMLLPQAPSLTAWLFEIQTLWIAGLDAMSNYQLPIAQLPAYPVEISTLFIALAIVSVFWIFGNGFLLRNQRK